MREVIDQRCGGARFVIENPINPSNAWACLRTLDSFGVQYVDVVMDPKFYQVDAVGCYFTLSYPYVL